MNRRTTARCFVIPALLGLLLGPACPGDEFADYELVLVQTVFDAKEAFINAKPGTIIEFSAGRFEFTEELSLNVSHIVIRGQGMDETILDFANQEFGNQGIFAIGDHFVAQDFTIENPLGDGIRVESSNGVTFRRVRIEWTSGADSNNGPYGLYPVLSDNVLIEGCIVRGASDAGIYVGQSNYVIVRDSLVEFNVAGIEIENTSFADVYNNVATNNTAGILVFDLPGLTQPGHDNRVFDNEVYSNNTPNFAPPGGIIGQVPAGIGFILMANDRVEIFDNVAYDNITTNLAIVSYLVLMTGNPQPGVYDPYPDAIYVHDNDFTDSGSLPQPALGALMWAFFFPDPLPDIVWDGWFNESEDPTVGGAICIQNSGGHFGNIYQFQPPAGVDLTDPAPHDCVLRTLPPTTVNLERPPVPEVEEEYTPEEIAALCAGNGQLPNRDAFVVDCPKLSDYGLFVGNDPTGASYGGGLPYDLTTPLFSDYAEKYRVLFLPPGETVAYDEEEVLGFPVGTVIAKTFTFYDDLSDPTSDAQTWIETRLLIHRESGWVGLPYIWDGFDEAWLEVGGGSADVSWTHTDGTPRETTYQVPDKNQCGRCHQNDNQPIGPKVRLLNRTYPYAGGAANQLDQWTNLGLLTGAPAPENAPRLPVWDDPTDGTVAERARAYLESNCAHCHHEDSPSGLILTIDQPEDFSLGICKRPIAAGAGAGDLDFDVVPGDPDASILIFRLGSADPIVRMPELSKSIVHEEAVPLIRAYIESLPGGCE